MAVCKNGRNISLLIEGYPRCGLELFSRIVGSGPWGVCITRLHPSYVGQKFGLKAAKCYWLSGCKGDAVLSPRSLSGIVGKIRSEVAGRQEGIVYLDGLEYLLLYNDGGKVMQMLEDIDAILAKSEVTMLISIDPLTLEPRDVAKLYDAYPRCTPDEAASSLLRQLPQRIAAAVPSSASQTV
jgi:hypothetical protein